MLGTTRSLIRTFRSPVPAETKRLLRAAWDRLPEHLRTPSQFIGRVYAGCAATIGAMPRYDFACRGCYLGAEANRIPAQSVDELKRQLRRIRAWVGEGGDLQLTDGEVTLRPEGELIELVQYARHIGLVPMIMTHGDMFRRHKGLLERLMVDAGLSEVSFHVDTTQRGRRGSAYKYATREEEPMPLRDEFAQVIRQARRVTGRTLDVATTLTITPDNLTEVPGVMRWLCNNAGAFKMVSFQPIAQVGRTEDGLGHAVRIEELWEKITQGLFGDHARAEELLEDKQSFGHPDCNRFVQGIVVSQPGQPPIFHTLFRSADPQDQAVLQELIDRFGGLTFRLHTTWQATARLAGTIAGNIRFMALKVAPFLLRWVKRFDPNHPLRFVWRYLRGRATVDYLNIISHHFMSGAQIETPTGQERLNLCVFQVPIGDDMVSMCAVNALGIRERYYDEIRTRTAA